jgi:peptidoglycan/xylan/chitin deacetylase (PgdA/CDA1 family)
MTIDQVRQLADEGFAIGVHGASHAPLAHADAGVQRQELESCRSMLESWIGRSVRTLAYPFGTPQVDYTSESVSIAASLGFTAGFSTHNDFARKIEPPLERSRFVVLDALTAAELAHRIAYGWPR